MRSTLGWILCVVSIASSVASAQPLEWWGPDGRVPTEGFLLGLLGHEKAQVSATGAQVHALESVGSLASYWVVPSAGAREVIVRAQAGAQTAEQRFLLGPEASQVELTLNPALPIKGRDLEAMIQIRTVDANGRPAEDSAPPVLVANVGMVKDLQRLSVGVFQGRYVLPSTRYPEVAIVVAYSAWPHPQSIEGATGVLRVPLASNIDLTGVTEPHAMTSLMIAGQKYGPVEANAEGKFSVPVVLPPGYPTAEATAVDRAGNRRTHTLDLRVPLMDPLACVVHPKALPLTVNARARVVCAVSDPFGKAVWRTGVTLMAGLGTVVPSGGPNEWIYTPPSRSVETEDHLEARWADHGRTIHEPFSVGFRDGPIHSLTVSPIETVIHQKSATPFFIELKDAQGRPQSRGTVNVTPSEGTVTLTPVGPGKIKAVWSLAKTEQRRATLAVQAIDAVGESPARLHAWRAEGALMLGVTDLAGLPVPGQILRVGSATVETGRDGTARFSGSIGKKIDIWHQAWTSLRRTLRRLPDGKLFPESAPLRPPSWFQDVQIAPDSPVNIRTRRHAREVTYWLENAEGDTLSSRDVVVSASDGVRTQRRDAGSGRTVIQIHPHPHVVSLSITDMSTGVMAVVQVPP